MIGTRIFYRSKTNIQKGPYNKTGSSTTAKIKKQECPLCHIMMAPADPELRFFLVHGKKVPFNLTELKKYCYQFGWEMPNITKNVPFNIEGWLVERAKNTIEDLPVDDLGDKWFSLVDLAATIGLKTNFFQAIRK